MARFASKYLLLAFPLGALALPQMVFSDPDQFTSYCQVTDINGANITGDPWQQGSAVSGVEGATVSFTETYTLTQGFTVGADLGLSFGDLIKDVLGASVGVSASAQFSKATATASGASSTCPKGNWYCSGLIYPGVRQWAGHIEINDNIDSTCNGPNKQLMSDRGDLKDGDKWEYRMPRVDAANNGVATQAICTCHNLAHWADPGHPGTLCPEDCVAPVPT